MVRISEEFNQSPDDQPVESRSPLSPQRPQSPQSPLINENMDKTHSPNNSSIDSHHQVNQSEPDQNSSHLYEQSEISKIRVSLDQELKTLVSLDAPWALSTLTALQSLQGLSLFESIRSIRLTKPVSSGVSARPTKTTEGQNLGQLEIIWKPPTYSLKSLIQKYLVRTDERYFIAYMILESILQALELYILPLDLKLESFTLTQKLEPRLQCSGFKFYPTSDQIRSLINQLLVIIIAVLTGQEVEPSQGEQALDKYNCPLFEHYDYFFKVFKPSLDNYLNRVRETKFYLELQKLGSSVPELLAKRFGTDKSDKIDKSDKTELQLNLSYHQSILKRSYQKFSADFKENLNLVLNVSLKFEECDVRTLFNTIDCLYRFPPNKDKDQIYSIAVFYLNCCLFFPIDLDQFLKQVNPSLNRARVCQKIHSFMERSHGALVYPNLLTTTEQMDKLMEALDNQLRRIEVYPSIEFYPAKQIPDDILTKKVKSCYP